MAKLHTFAALTIALATVACAGPTQTAQPRPTAQLPTAAAPTATPMTSGPPTATPSAQETPPTPTTPTPSPTEQPPSIGRAWTQLVNVAPGPSPREDHTWTLLDDGTVAYLFGGRGAAGAVLGDLWQYDLFTDTWTELHPSGDGPAARFGHTATWVPDLGRVVVWSGQGARFFDDIWAYNPMANAWEELPSLGAVPEARYGSCASLGPDGELWISHGFTADDGRFADTRSYNFESGTWTDRTPTTGDLPVSRCLHDCYWSSAGKLILYGGQTTGVQSLGDLWSLDPAAAWTRAPDPSVRERNLYGLAVGPDGAVVFGGGSLDKGFLDDTWLIVDTVGMRPFDVLGEAPPARSSATLIYSAYYNRYLLFGGMDGEGVLGDLWELK